MTNKEKINELAKGLSAQECEIAFCALLGEITALGQSDEMVARIERAIQYAKETAARRDAYQFEAKKRMEAK